MGGVGRFDRQRQRRPTRRSQRRVGNTREPPAIALHYLAMTFLGTPSIAHFAMGRNVHTHPASLAVAVVRPPAPTQHMSSRPKAALCRGSGETPVFAFACF